jgi:hypothetical protein
MLKSLFVLSWSSDDVDIVVVVIFVVAVTVPVIAVTVPVIAIVVVSVIFIDVIIIIVDVIEELPGDDHSAQDKRYDGDNKRSHWTISQSFGLKIFWKML